MNGEQGVFNLPIQRFASTLIDYLHSTVSYNRIEDFKLIYDGNIRRENVKPEENGLENN